jgi:predicted kinase
MAVKKKFLFVTVGFPGSGKTYFSSRLAKEYNLAHLNSDYFRLSLIKDPKYTKAEHGIVFNAMDLVAEMFLLKGISVIYDANATKIEYRRRLKEMAKRLNSNYCVLMFETPVKEALLRISKRHLKHKNDPLLYRKIKPEVLHRIRKEIEISPKEKIVKLDGTKPYKLQKVALKKFINI